MRKYIQLFILILFSCTESDYLGKLPPPRPVFPWWDNFYCNLGNKEKWTVLWDSEGKSLCKPEDVRYILHLSVPVSETVSCESQAENILRKKDFLKEFASPSDPLTAKEEHSNRMASGEEDTVHFRNWRKWKNSTQKKAELSDAVRLILKAIPAVKGGSVNVRLVLVHCILKPNLIFRISTTNWKNMNVSLKNEVYLRQ